MRAIEKPADQRALNYLLALCFVLLVVLNTKGLLLTHRLGPEDPGLPILLLCLMLAGSCLLIIHFIRKEAVKRGVEGVRWIKKLSNSVSVGTVRNCVVFRDGSRCQGILALKLVKRPNIPLVESLSGSSHTYQLVEHINLVTRLRDAIVEIQSQGIACAYAVLPHPQEAFSFKTAPNLMGSDEHKGHRSIPTSVYAVLVFETKCSNLVEAVKRKEADLTVVKSVLEAMVTGVEFEQVSWRELVKSSPIFFC